MRLLFSTYLLFFLSSVFTAFFRKKHLNLILHLSLVNMSLIYLIVFLVMLQIEDYFAARMISAETLKRNRVMQKRIGDEVLTNTLLNLLVFKL